MKNVRINILFTLATGLCVTACNQNKAAPATASATPAQPDYCGFTSQIKYGEHLVKISGCNDCHTPKKMGAKGPEPDTSRLLSGHPAKQAAPDVNRRDMEAKGLSCSDNMTAWVGPWGISYGANLTPDSTGLGAWNENAFITCLRTNKYQSRVGSRDMLPPMPDFSIMTNDELKAVFAYLQSLKPVNNTPPEPEAPVMKK